MPGKAGTGIALSLRTTTASLASSLLGLFFPARCRICDDTLDGISRVPVCPQCWDKAAPLPDEGLCVICGLPHSTAVEPVLATFQCQACIQHPPRFAIARSYGVYGGSLRELVHLLKYNGMFPLATPLGERMASVATRPAWRDEFARCQAVVAVPLSADRKKSRGYNQAELVARVVARRLKLPLIPASAFRRVRATSTQAGLTRPQRRENVHDAFAAETRAVDGRVILLIDDVMTTGATLDSCAACLCKAGASEVLALTVARTPSFELS